MKVPQIDRTQETPKMRRHWKRLKVKAERRRAKAKPDCVPGYGRYKDYTA